MFEEATMTREETVKECKRLADAMRKSKSETLKRDYGKKLKRLQKRLLYQAD
jgi:hypothetical protein